ncbi:MAG: hypothetical protein GDA68_18825 [Nitrospira sp. CR2.1]|nr:hypothetical protein [Nitrospira sp. CR2.1]
MAPHPRFYWCDADQDGHWRMSVDREGAGQAASAELYDWRQGEEVLTLSKSRSRSGVNADPAGER